MDQIEGLNIKTPSFGVFGLMAIVGIIVLAILSSVTRVNAGEIGVVKEFGAINADNPRVFEPGIHLRVPIRDEVVIFDTKIQKDQVNSSASSKDGVMIMSTITMNYHIDPAKAPLILQDIGANYRDRIIEQQMQQAFKDVTARYAGLELIQKRGDVALNAKAILHEKLMDYHIIVDEFTIPNFEFPPEFNAAILATQVATQQNLQAMQLQEMAKTDAETASIVAQGQANAQKSQATTLTPQYLQLQAIQKWDGKLPQYLTPSAPLPFIGTVAQP
jgi:regulator of protease activity HflC (stomatin/prohibitin superfamily)